MPSVLYVCRQDADNIAAFAVDDASGRLTPRGETAAPGGPSITALGAGGRVLYVGHRTRPAISTYRIDPAGGGLSLQGSVPADDPPTYLAPDRSGRYLLSAYYQGGYVAVHPVGADGSVAGPPVDRHATQTGAHAIATDPSNRFAFVPHIARLNDNVLEPPKNNPGPNVILQFRFDAATGRLSPNAPLRVEQAELAGPRHYCFHPSLDLVYVSHEQGSGVGVYRLDRASGTLAALQTIGSLPGGFSGRNTCSQIHLAPAGNFLYVGNRGHNSIAGFAVNAANGLLIPAGHVPTEAVPTAFALDPEGRFLFAAGTATGRLAAYRVDAATGRLSPLETYAVGGRPAAVQAVRLG